MMMNLLISLAALKQCSNVVSDGFVYVFQVTGDSIYNLVRLGEIETNKDDRPLDPPPRILSVEVDKHVS